MNVIVCVDNRGGMGFNGRRQSRDRVLTEYLLKLRGTQVLRMDPDSLPLFEGGENILASRDFLEIAGEDDFCFAENQALSPYESRIQKLILCRWNRDYPADLFLDLPVNYRTLLSREEFPGSSHDKLTIEVYGK